MSLEHQHHSSGYSYAEMDDLEDALIELRDTDIHRLALIARHLSATLSFIDDFDLLSESIIRALEGKRKWPTSVPLVTFLAGVMRSLSSEYRNQEHRRSEFDENSINDNSKTDNQFDNRLIERYDAKSKIQKIESLFENDDIALSIIMGLADGMSASEIQIEFELSKTQYNSARKKIRRKITKHFR